MHRFLLILLLSIIFQATAPLTWAGPLATLSDGETVRGLRDALVLGAEKAVSRLGQEDGFLLNEKVRIPLPDSLERVDGPLRRFGMGHYADDLVTTMNRAAEAAMPEARMLLMDAVNSMTIQDGKDILTGGDDAATRYFRRQTEAGLSAHFLPVVQRATKKVRLADAYNQFAGKGVRLGLIRAEDANLDQYVTRKALDGLYATIADEERAIRANPLDQSQKTLRRVFGALLQ
jgi:hypothetical protein